MIDLSHSHWFATWVVVAGCFVVGAQNSIWSFATDSHIDLDAGETKWHKSVIDSEAHAMAMARGKSFLFHSTPATCQKLLPVLRNKQSRPVITTNSAQSVGFVGLVKSGSVFMQYVLDAYAPRECLWAIHDPNNTICEHGAAMGWHHASALFQIEFLGRDVWERAFTFALVRNPWAKVVSAFVYFSRDTHVRDVTFASVSMHSHNSPSACFSSTLWTEANVSILCFRHWLLRFAQQHPVGSPEEYLLGGFPIGNQLLSHGLNASQLSWLVDGEQNLAVDRIYKLEELAQSWSDLQAHVVGFRSVEYADLRGRFSHNPSSHAPYKLYYDQETRCIIARYMAVDISFFGYKDLLPTSCRIEGIEQG